MRAIFWAPSTARDRPERLECGRMACIAKPSRASFRTRFPAVSFWFWEVAFLSSLSATLVRANLVRVARVLVFGGLGPQSLLPFPSQNAHCSSPRPGDSLVFRAVVSKLRSSPHGFNPNRMEVDIYCAQVVRQRRSCVDTISSKGYLPVGHTYRRVYLSLRLGARRTPRPRSRWLAVHSLSMRPPGLRLQLNHRQHRGARKYH